MKPPKSINVFGRKIDIKIVDELLDDDGKELEGLYTPENAEIVLAKCDMQVLLHELVHAVCNRTGIRQSNVSTELEEVIAENISTFLTETFNLRFKRK